MKNLLLGLLMTASCPVFSQFYPANIPEVSYPPIPAGDAFRAHHSSAYSYPEVNVNGNTVDLYTYSWDGGGIIASTYVPGATIAIRQYPSGTTPDAGLPSGEDYDPTGFPTDDAASIEVVLLKRGTDILVLSAYYQISTERFMLNLFKWDGITLSQETGYPIDITVSASTVDFEWIRMDALALDKFIITWIENGRILTKAGKVGASVDYGNTATLNVGDQAYDQPDVALIDVLEGEPQAVKAHYVYTTDDHQKLYVAGLLFNDVFSASAGAALTPVIEDAQTTTGTYGLPRIDAPDKYGTDDWSYVVEEHFTQVSSTIFAGIMHQPVLIHRKLNDATETGFPNLDLSPWPNQNVKPVVAYAAGGADIYYCWGYEGINPPPTPNINHSLLGLKMDNAGNFLAPAPGDMRYSFVPRMPLDVSGTISIALSGNNINSPGLFMAFVQLFMYPEEPADYYTMGIKVSPWSDAHFRPLDIEEQELASDLAVYPNPFTTYFQLRTERPFRKLSIRLYDPLGRQLLHTSGHVKEVNRQLQEHSADFATGNYFLYVTADKEAPVVFKLSKAN